MGANERAEWRRVKAEKAERSWPLQRVTHHRTPSGGMLGHWGSLRNSLAMLGQEQRAGNKNGSATEHCSTAGSARDLHTHFWTTVLQVQKVTLPKKTKQTQTCGGLLAFNATFNYGVIVPTALLLFSRISELISLIILSGTKCNYT